MSGSGSKKTKTLYTVKCAGGKWYVGSTTQTPAERLKQHKDQKGDGAEWTKLHTPLELVQNVGPSTLDPNDPFSEDTLVLRTMQKYGICNVRGGSYSQVNLSTAQVTEIQKKIAAASNLCFRCNAPGHYIKQCPLEAALPSAAAAEAKRPAVAAAAPALLPASIGELWSALALGALMGAAAVKAPAVAATIAVFGAAAALSRTHPYTGPSSFRGRGRGAGPLRSFSGPVGRPRQLKCYRCGRASHLSNVCHAKLHIDGHVLK